MGLDGAGGRCGVCMCVSVVVGGGGQFFQVVFKLILFGIKFRLLNPMACFTDWLISIPAGRTKNYANVSLPARTLRDTLKNCCSRVHFESLRREVSFQSRGQKWPDVFIRSRRVLYAPV